MKHKQPYVSWADEMAEERKLTQDQIDCIEAILDGANPSDLGISVGTAAIFLAAAELIWKKAGEDSGEYFDRCRELRKFYGEAAHLTGEFEPA